MSDGMVKSGVQFNPEKNVGFAYTEQDQDYNGPESLLVTGAEATAGIDQTPLDIKAAKVRQYDLAAIAAAFEAIKFKYPIRLRQVDLPRVLTGITIVESSSTGTGMGNHPQSQQAFTIESGSGSVNARDSAESSAVISFEVQPSWKAVPRSNVAAMAYGFYLATNIANEAAILTALADASLANATVNAWPLFKEAEESLVLTGGEASVRSSADTTASVSLDFDGFVRLAAVNWGDEYSIQVGTNSKVVTLPPCIHAAITGYTTSTTKTATATVAANTNAITKGMSTVISAITNSPGARTKTAVATVTPTTLAATSPTAIPSTGLYLYDYSIQDVGFGIFQIIAIVLDMSIYA